LAKKKNITIEQKVVDLFLKADEEKIIRLLVILLDNAIKFSQRGSKVKIVATKADHQVEIKVIDFGIGIADKDLPHIFDRFFRVDKSRSLTEVMV